jgi:hypothetical protein
MLIARGQFLTSAFKRIFTIKLYYKNTKKINWLMGILNDNYIGKNQSN